MKFDVTREADRLNSILANPRESKNSRNAAITLLRDLSAKVGRNLRTA